jgi:hypothetical protein
MPLSLSLSLHLSVCVAPSRIRPAHCGTLLPGRFPPILPGPGESVATVWGQVPASHYGHHLAASGGALYTYGGATAAGFDAGLALYLPALRIFVAAGPGALVPTNTPPAARAFFGLAAVGKSLYVFGGMTNDAARTPKLRSKRVKTCDEIARRKGCGARATGGAP